MQLSLRPGPKNCKLDLLGKVSGTQVGTVWEWLGTVRPTLCLHLHLGMPVLMSAHTWVSLGGQQDPLWSRGVLESYHASP